MDPWLTIEWPPLCICAEAVKASPAKTKEMNTAFIVKCFKIKNRFSNDSLKPQKLRL